MTNQKKPMFERRHFNEVAEKLGFIRSARLTTLKGDFRHDGFRRAINQVEQAFIDMFKNDNSNFDIERFRGAVSKAEDTARFNLDDVKKKLKEENFKFQFM